MELAGIDNLRDVFYVLPDSADRNFNLKNQIPIEGFLSIKGIGSSLCLLILLSFRL
jgi:hypothetical protein